MSELVENGITVHSEIEEMFQHLPEASQQHVARLMDIVNRHVPDADYNLAVTLVKQTVVLAVGAIHQRDEAIWARLQAESDLMEAQSERETMNYYNALDILRYEGFDPRTAADIASTLDTCMEDILTMPDEHLPALRRLVGHLEMLNDDEEDD